MDNIETRVLKLEILLQNYVEDTAQLTKTINEMAKNIEEIKMGLRERMYVNGTHQQALVEVREEIESIRKDTETLKKFFWGLAGAFAVVEFIFRYILR